MIVRFAQCDPREVASLLQQLPTGITHLPELEEVRTRSLDVLVNFDVAIDAAKIVAYLAAAWVARAALRLGPHAHIYLNGHHVRDDAELSELLHYCQDQQHKNDREHGP